MMNYILFDREVWKNFLPLTYTKPLAELRMGILTIKEKWEHYLDDTCTYKTIDYLQEKYPIKLGVKNLFINACLLPNKKLVERIQTISVGEALCSDGKLLAYCCKKENESFEISNYQIIDYDNEVVQLNSLTDFFKYNGQEIESDFELLTKGKISEPIPEGVQVVKKERIFIEQGTNILFSSLNASEGAIYIRKNATIMEGCNVRGPFCLGSHATLKMGAKMYGSTTIGPHCKIGGEVGNSVFMGYSNKGHDGFLGNSVIGEWCNFGAGSSNSNLKNNYSTVKLWSYVLNDFADTNLQFCGLMMGDYSKCGINTSINTGSVVGVCTNYFGSGVPSKFLPSFSWGNSENSTTYDFEKAIKTAEIVMDRRNIKFTEIDKNILRKVLEISEKYRNRFSRN